MRLSIIVPSFNQAHFLEDTLDSIFSQNHPDVEVVVVDGASTDGTVELLRRRSARHPGLRWISEPDDGPADAVNKGLAMASGEICGIQSADDLYHPGAFARVTSVFAAHPDCGMVFGDVEGIDADGRHIFHGHVPPFSWPAWLGIALSVPQSSIFFRTALGRALGGWRAQYYSCDLDFWLRMVFRTRVCRINATLSAWRVYPEQRTRPERFGQIIEGYRQMLLDNPDLAGAPLRVRLMARASVHIMALQLGPPKSPLRHAMHLLAALCLHPGFLRYQHPARRRRMLPGYAPLAAGWRRLRRLASTGTRT